MTKFDGPGPGRKQCKSCKTYVGVRTAICPCGSSFAQKAPTPKPAVAPVAAPAADAAQQPAEVQPVGRRPVRVYAASGGCPIPYDGDLSKWTKKVQAFGAERGVMYDPVALGLWLKEYVRDFGEWDRLTAKLEE